MARRLLIVLLALPVALAACGTGEDVNTATYTCAQFNKSLRTKDDNTSGNFINRLREQAKLGQAKQTEVRELTLGIFLACRGKPGSTKPAKKAIATAKQIRAGTFKLPGRSSVDEKKSTQ